MRSKEDVESIREELVDRFGELPAEAQSLLVVAQLRAFAKSLGISEVVAAGKFLRISPLVLPESKQLRLNRLFPGSLYKTATNTVMIAIPRAASWTPTAEGSKVLGDTSLLDWASASLHQLTE